MPGLLESRDPGRGYFTARQIVVGCAVLFVVLLPAAPASRAVAAWTAFMVVFALTAWIMSRDSLRNIRATRYHRERVFENDKVDVTLELEQTTGLSQLMVLVQDQFVASLGIYQRNLVPMMSPHWKARLRYRKEAERHRGLYLLGPVRIWAADPLGIFYRDATIDCISRLTVYPRAIPLGGYTLPGPDAPMGPSMDTSERLGQGEEIMSVRPYQAGDPWTRIHWRTSVRRRELHTMELDSNLQTEVALLLDLTKRSRFGTGVESTTETVIGCATSILSEAANARHRMSLTCIREEVEALPAATGIAHLQLLLDRLAMISEEGMLEFWEAARERASILRAGSRAIFVAVSGTTSLAKARPIVEQLIWSGVAVDVIFAEDSKLARIWRFQQPSPGNAPALLDDLKDGLEEAGARVFILERGENAAELLPHAAESDPKARAFV